MGQDSYCMEQYWKEKGEKGKKKKKSLQSRSKITPILKEDTNLGQKDCSLQWTFLANASQVFINLAEGRWEGSEKNAFSPQNL